MKTGTATLPLHGGQCPAWLFAHMKKLSQAIVEVIIEEYGVSEVLRRLSDPFWFQALGCVVGFDWHSSGVTTTVCGALKEGLQSVGPEAGLFCAGGKGRTARRTPDEIRSLADRYPIAIDAEQLVYASKMAAKVDSAAVQDGFQIYHHFFVFDQGGHWAVIQQGKNDALQEARRYHWLSAQMPSFTEEPQRAVCGDSMVETLNLVSKYNQSLNQLCADISRQLPEQLIGEFTAITSLPRSVILPGRHSIPSATRLNKALRAAYELQPQNFEQLLQVSGVGAATLRAICLVAEVAYGSKPSYADPVRYAFAHGGKDGFPFPVNEEDIGNSYQILHRAVLKAKQGRGEQLRALRNLASWHSEAVTIKATPPPGGYHRKTPPATSLCHTNPGQQAPLVQPGLF
jgi:hypothetical protein